MHLTSHTDYALRVLLVLGLRYPQKFTTRQIGAAFEISENHLVKVIQTLAQHGYVETIRGKDGGVRLAKPPERINIGRVIRQVEQDLGVVPCLRVGGQECFITPVCGLRSVLAEATQQFLQHLDRYTLGALLADAPLKDAGRTTAQGQAASARPVKTQLTLHNVVARRLPQLLTKRPE